MKKLLVLAALTVAAAPAMASKARLTALGNSDHLIDAQTIFKNSADIHYLSDFATIEFGSPTGDAPNKKAEGGFVRSSSMGKFGAYLGHQSATVNEFVSTINALIDPDLLNEQNALDLMYGTELIGLKWGFGLHYSNAKDEGVNAATLGNRKENTLGVNAGVRTDVWNAYLRLGLMGKTESDLTASGSPSLEQKGLYDAGFGYWIDTLYVSAKYLLTKGTLTVGATDTDVEKTDYSINVIDNVKVEGGNFFYGASYTNIERKFGNSKQTAMGLPLIAGIEVDATSWMVLRGSISQTVLLQETKTEAATDLKTNLLNDTVASAGVGLKFGKLMVDATLAGSSTTGEINGNSLLANASLTYAF